MGAPERYDVVPIACDGPILVFASHGPRGRAHAAHRLRRAVRLTWINDAPDANALS